jgi:DNA-directed RNA polymerase specialized sigma24 family protein
MGRDELNLLLLQLAVVAQESPPGSLERRVSLTKLVNLLMRSTCLWRPPKIVSSPIYQEIYNEARQELFLYICQHIEKYNPERATVIVWVNVLFERRFFRDAIRKMQPHNRLETVSLNELDDFLSAPVSTPNTSEVLKEYIELDPENIFKNQYIEKCPKANFQAILKRRMMGQSWKDISTEFNLKVPTISSFYYRCINRFSDKFKEFYDNQID